MAHSGIKPKSYLITGSAGFIYLHLVEALIEKGIIVLFVDESSYRFNKTLPPILF